MAGRFAVKGTFHIPIRRLFVVHGQILDGTVQAGQYVRSPAGIETPVSAVEFVLLSAADGREDPALAFCYRSDTELARWQTLKLVDHVLELEDGVRTSSGVEPAAEQ